ncbi:MAG: chalcone isomerase family protein [Rubrivivax sp.]|nr:chalcone isomerase family protein [Rubrivivax sp.]
MPAGANAPVPAELGAELPAARLQGSGRLRFFGLHVYDARLWTGERRAGADDWAATPMALEIEYARRLVGAQIAERSLEEMRRQGAIAEADAERWLAEMKRLFPDVAAGDRITGVKVPGTAARFFVNGRFRGELRDADFTRRFFGIWLARETSQPALRDALLGARAAGS